MNTDLKKVDEVMLRTLKHLEQILKSCDAKNQPTEFTVCALREAAQYFLTRDKIDKAGSIDKVKADKLTSLVTKDKIKEWMNFPGNK